MPWVDLDGNPITDTTPYPTLTRTDAGIEVRHGEREWLLAEYACCFLPTQPHAVVEEICKSLPHPLPAEVVKALQLERIDAQLSHKQSQRLRFTTVAEIERNLSRYVGTLPIENSIHEALQRSWKKLSGRV